MPFIETRQREERTIDRLEKGCQVAAMADGLSQTNKIARELERARETYSELEGARESQDGDIELSDNLYMDRQKMWLCQDGHYATENVR